MFYIVNYIEHTVFWAWAQSLARPLPQLSGIFFEFPATSFTSYDDIYEGTGDSSQYISFIVNRESATYEGASFAVTDGSYYFEAELSGSSDLSRDDT